MKCRCGNGLNIICTLSFLAPPTSQFLKPCFLRWNNKQLREAARAAHGTATKADASKISLIINNSLGSQCIATLIPLNSIGY